MTRVRWMALGLLLGLASIAWGQGGPGLFFASSCSSLSNPVTGSTLCWQTSPPYSLLYWDGAAFSQPTLGGPYAPTTYGQNGVLYGNSTGPILVTSQGGTNTILAASGGAPAFTDTPTLAGLTTTAQAALTLGVYGTSTGNTGELRLRELAANGTDYVGFKAPDSIAALFIMKLPSIPGTNGQCIVTDGATPVSTLSWGACSGGGSGITSLNALTGAIQTFTNDTNVTVVSGGSAHVLTWAGTLAVSRGGLGVGTLAANGVLYGNGTSAVQASAAGSADQVFRVPGAGNPPAFGALDVSKAAAITGLVRTANLGSGSATSATFLRGDQTWAAAAGTQIYNYVFNSDMEVWGSGTATHPTGWTSAGGTFAKNTTAGQFKTGTASVSITLAGGTAGLYQDLAVVNPPVTFWRSQVVTCGVWARATVASTTFISIADDGGTTDSGFHSGGGAFEFLTVSRSISNVTTLVFVLLSVGNTNTTSQFDSVICVLGSSITNWQPSGYIGRKGTFMMSTGASPIAAATTQYFGFWGPVVGGVAVQATVPIPTPFRAVFRNCSGLVSAAPGGADTDSFTLRVNEAAASPLPAFVISAAATQGSDVTNEVDVAKAARVATRIATSATAAAAKAVMTCEMEEVPEGI